jgi:hypothetical protein
VAAAVVDGLGDKAHQAAAAAAVDQVELPLHLRAKLAITGLRMTTATGQLTFFIRV